MPMTTEAEIREGFETHQRANNKARVLLDAGRVEEARRVLQDAADAWNKTFWRSVKSGERQPCGHDVYWMNPHTLRCGNPSHTRSDPEPEDATYFPA